MARDELTSELEIEAKRLGFAACGVTTMEPFERDRDRALTAIAEGRMEGMPWYTPERINASADLAARYPWARSIVSLAWPYRPAAAPGSTGNAGQREATRGRFAAYACLRSEDGSVDYHLLLARRCKDLAGWLRERAPGSRAKHFVDHGWAMDRAIAERAGIGFTGKNTTLITREAGSYVLLAELLTSVELAAGAPSRKACGSCHACLPACPTGALVSPGVIDSPRCISYLTIEHHGSVPEGLRPLIGTWAFGCDLCQEACPINERLAPPALEAGPASTRSGPVPYPDLVDCLELTEAEFAERFHGTAVARAGRAGLARNCAVALGNAGATSAISALERARAHDDDDAVRDAADWALRRLVA